MPPESFSFAGSSFAGLLKCFWAAASSQKNNQTLGLLTGM